MSIQMANVLEQLKKMNKWYEKDTMDEILTRDEFLDEDIIEEVLNCASEHAWNWVYEHRSKYSTRIRMRIEPDDYRVSTDKLKIRVVELTDKEWERIQREKQKLIDDEFEKVWVKHASTLQDRGLTTVDSELDDAWEKFCIAREAYTKYLERPAVKKYVAPGTRDKLVTDSRADELQAAIAKAENEYDLAQKAVENADELYWNTKRSEYRITWMPSM
jgi:hypothetical protein